MEEKLLEAIEKTLGHLSKDEEQCKKELEEINKKISIGESIEEKEYKEDLKKIQEEIKDKQEDKEKATNLFKLKQEKEDENKKLNDAKSKMLKNKEQCEDAIKQMEGKKEYKDGKLVDTQELLEYKNDLEKINAELAKIENRIEKNSKEIVEFKKEISNLYTKYKVKEEKEVEPKKDKDKDKSKPQPSDKKKQTKAEEKHPEEKKEDLQKQLEESAKRMAEYRKNGFFAQEAEEHKTYNELLKKINKEKPEKDDFQPPAVVEKDKFQPPAVVEKDKFQPPAVVEKDKFQPPAVVENNKDTEKRNNLPIRSFWEIYNDTCTEHVGSIARNINKLSHMKLLPSKDEDTLQKILSAPTVIFKAPMKLLAKIPNAIMGTDRKIAEMAENIDSLSPQEFQVLVQSPKEVNKMFRTKVKEDIDRDYLDPQFMKQYKVNNAYLDVVRARLGRERGAAIELYNAQAKSAYDRLNELEEIGRENWTQEQKDEYNTEISLYQNCVDEGKKCQKELDTFDEGAKKKSSAYRNISGWFLAKFNPDNREENAKMAELSKARREVLEQGKENEANVYTKKMQEELRNNTKIVGGIKNFLDRGLYSFESPVDILDRGPQNKGKLLLTNLALVTSIAKLYEQYTNNLQNMKSVRIHNEKIQQVNRDNTDINVNGNVKVSDSPQAGLTEETITRQTVEAGWNNAERGNLSSSNWNINDNTYIQRDLQAHAEAAEATKSASSLINDGNQLDALKVATDYYQKVKTSASPRTIAHAQEYSANNYDAFNFGNSADAKVIYDFFQNGTVPYSTNITAAMAEMMPQLKQGMDMTVVIFAGVNAMYQAQKDKDKDIKNRVRVTVPTERHNDENENQNQDQDRENDVDTERDD